MRHLFLVAALAALAAGAGAHDVWIEPGANLVRTGEPLALALMLGNHGNAHRDFRLAGKLAPGTQNLEIVGPKGERLDLTPTLLDTGYAPQEGFWLGRFAPSAPGLYLAHARFDAVMSYAPVRDVKSAKAFFLSSPTLDRVDEGTRGYDRVLGDPLELVPVVHPVTPMGAGGTLRVRLLFKGRPLANEVVNFVPRGAEAKGEFDGRYAARTDARGEAEMTLREATTYLVSAHRHTDESGEGYRGIGYSATLCLIVPAACPCCR